MDPQTTDTFPTMILFHTFTADMGACYLEAQIGPAAEVSIYLIATVLCK